jgi:transcriptional regulator with XRE-family HTH domain
MQHDPVTSSPSTSAGPFQLAGAPSTLGQRIRHERLAQGRSIRDVVGDTLSPSLISRIERDLVAPSLDTLHFIASRLDRSVAYFLTGEETGIPGARGKDELLEAFATLFEDALAGAGPPAGMPMDAPVGDIASCSDLTLLAQSIQQGRRDTATETASDLLDSLQERLRRPAVGSSALATFFPAVLAAIGARLTGAVDGEHVAADYLRDPQGPASEGRLLLEAEAILPNGAEAESEPPPPSLGRILDERLAGARDDVRKAHAQGDTARALLAAGWGMGLLEMRCLSQSYVDVLVVRTLHQPIAASHVDLIERFARTVGYPPSLWVVLAAAERALGQQELDCCARLLDLVPADQRDTAPGARKIMARLTYALGDVTGAVQRWCALADDPAAPRDFVLATLMESGMLLDEAGHAGEAQTLYRRAAELWQQTGPRSGVGSRAVVPSGLKAGGYARTGVEAGAGNLSDMVAGHHDARDEHGLS